MDNWSPNDDDQNNGYDLNNNQFQNQHTDDIEDIIRQINQKASNKRFELNIADEEFYQIPDVEYKQPRYKEIEDNIEKESQGNDEPINTIAPPELPKKGLKPRKMRPKKNIKRTGVFGGIVYVLCVIGVSIVLSVVILQSAQDFLGLFKEKQALKIVVPDGATVKDIAIELEQLGVIRQPFTFEIYTKYKKELQEIKPGTFEIDKNMSYDEIISKLKKDKEKGVVSITLLEGKTIFDLAEDLEDKGVCTSDDFFKALDERAENPVYDWEKAIPDSPERFSKYEGYFFPDTFQMYVGELPSSVITKFLDNFDAKFSNDMKNRAEDLGMSIDEVIILASMLEKEAASSVLDVDIVSAVFHNRLNNSSTYPQLQSDVTREYVNNFIQDKVTEEQRVIYANAYNTYKTVGLPIGPVCNPGTDTIRCALYPAEGREGVYFFVTDINNKFYYAKTNSEHNTNVAIAESVKDKEGKSNAGGISVGDHENED